MLSVNSALAIFHYLLRCNTTQNSHRRIDITWISFFKCSRASGLQARDEATQVDIGVVLSNTIPTAELPSNEFVAKTLIEAATTNETFSVSLKASLIQVICK